MKEPKARFVMLIFLISIMMAVPAWRMWRDWHRIRDATRFTAGEQTVLRFQILLLLPMSLASFARFLLPLPALARLAVGFVLGVSLFFIALTSIIYRVSILRGRGEREPLQGRRAIISGVVLLCITLVAFLVIV